MFKSLLKNAYIRLLEQKAKKSLSFRSTLIFVLGGQNKRVIAHQIHEIITKKHPALINALGYNHRIGIALSILGYHAGTSSIGYWISLLFKKNNRPTQKVYIQEVTSTTPEINQLIIDTYKPNFVVLEDGVENTLKNCKVITSKSGIVYLDAKEIGKLVSSQSNGTHEIVVVIESQKHTFTLNNFGVQYEIPTIIGNYLVNHLS